MCLAALSSGRQTFWLLICNFMLARFEQTHRRKAGAAFTLAELVIALAIFVLVTAGIIRGYTQSNSFAEWSAMSLAAQSYALQGLEQARAAKWSTSTSGTGPGSGDELPANTNYIQTNVMQMPISGQIFYVTNTIVVTNLLNGTTIPYPLRQIQSKCVWKFPLTGKWFTNTVVTERAPDQ
jgi:type II secretory pathway pseudopilin PulG